MMPAPMIAATASPALLDDRRTPPARTCASCGFGVSLTVISVMTASRPSEPVMSASRS